MISIGCDFFGPELKSSPIGKLLLETANRIAELRGGEWYGVKDVSGLDRRPRPSSAYFEVGSLPAVNIVFQVPGSLGDFPALSAPRPGRFSRKQQLLLVEVYVPREQVASGGSVEFVIDALRQSCVIAADVFDKKNMSPFDLSTANVIIDRVRDALLDAAATTRPR